MTRATIGGINSQDQIWYPLDVNAAGQARIDTSGIPVPMEWETGTWTPEYISTAGANWATITYGFQTGHFYRLGMLCWFTCALSTTELFVNITTGSIRLSGLPFTWENYGSNNSGAAASFGVINYGRTFETSVPVSFAL